MKKAAFFFILFLISFAGFGQTEKIINPSDLKQQTVITEPLSLNKGFTRVGLAYSYSALDKYFNRDGKKKYSPESTWGIVSGAQIMVQYGITDRLMAEVGVPFRVDVTNYHWRVYAPNLDYLEISDMSVRGSGLADLYLSGTFQVIPSSSHNFSLKTSLDVTIPTGRKNPENVVSAYDYDAPTGYGVFVLTPRITARLVHYPYSWVVYVQYSYNFSGSRIISPGDAVERNYRYGNNIYAGGGVNLHLNEWIALTNDLVYSYTGKGEIQNVSASNLTTNYTFSYQPRLIFQIRRFRLGEAVNIPLKGRLAGADPLYVLIAQYIF
jgi:hypothetical protein